MQAVAGWEIVTQAGVGLGWIEIVQAGGESDGLQAVQVVRLVRLTSG